MTDDQTDCIARDVGYPWGTRKIMQLPYGARVMASKQHNQLRPVESKIGLQIWARGELRVDDEVVRERIREGLERSCGTL